MPLHDAGGSHFSRASGLSPNPGVASSLDLEGRHGGRTASAPRLGVDPWPLGNRRARHRTRIVLWDASNHQPRCIRADNLGAHHRRVRFLSATAQPSRIVFRRRLRSRAGPRHRGTPINHRSAVRGECMAASRTDHGGRRRFVRCRIAATWVLPTARTRERESCCYAIRRPSRTFQCSDMRTPFRRASRIALIGASYRLRRGWRRAVAVDAKLAWTPWTGTGNGSSPTPSQPHAATEISGTSVIRGTGIWQRSCPRRELWLPVMTSCPSVRLKVGSDSEGQPAPYCAFDGLRHTCARLRTSCVTARQRNRTSSACSASLRCERASSRWESRATFDR